METIGSDIYIEILHRQNVPAKIDTGADSSSIWASKIRVTRDGTLIFKLFGPTSEFYNGKILKRTDFQTVMTRSAHGDAKISYRTHIPIKINGKKINVLFTLVDRSKNNFPVLIGKRTIKNKFIVDVSKRVTPPNKKLKTKFLNAELRKNPYEFHQKYIKSNQEKKS